MQKVDLPRVAYPGDSLYEVHGGMLPHTLRRAGGAAIVLASGTRTTAR
jgi:hypothetical protein